MKTLLKFALAVIGGAVTGGGIGSTQQERQLVVKNCLYNQGYKVFNWPWPFEMTQVQSLPSTHRH